MRLTIEVPAAYAGRKQLAMDGQTTALNAGAAGHYSVTLPAGRHRFELK